MMEIVLNLFSLVLWVAALFSADVAGMFGESEDYPQAKMAYWFMSGFGVCAFILQVIA